MPAAHFAPGITSLAEGTFSLVSVNQFHVDGTIECKVPMLPVTHRFVPVCRTLCGITGCTGGGRRANVNSVER